MTTPNAHTERQDLGHCPESRALADKAWRQVTVGLADFHQGRGKKALELVAARLRYKALLYPTFAAMLMRQAVCVEAVAATLDHEDPLAELDGERLPFHCLDTAPTAANGNSL